MGRVARGILVTVAALLAAAPAAQAQSSVQPWDGTNPFVCELQWAGFGPTGPNPSADPYCVEFDKRRQNVSQLGVVEFLSLEPARVAAASDKCFYYQVDHWRGSVAQDVPGTKTYEWDGRYFFDKAKGEGGVFVTNFNVNGQTGDPRDLPGFPESYKPYYGPGTGGTRTVGSVPADPRCAERAAREGSRIYAALRGAGARPPCGTPAGSVTTRRLGPLQLGDTESEVRRSLGPPSETRRGFLRYCLPGGARYLIGQREDRSGEFGIGATERTVMLVSSHSAYRYRGIGPGSSLRALRKRFRRARKPVVRYEGGNRIYVVRKRRSAVLFGVRRREVKFVVVRNLTAVRGKGAIKDYLRRAR